MTRVPGRSSAIRVASKMASIDSLLASSMKAHVFTMIASASAGSAVIS
jgi:hypothetical protein